MATVKNSQVNKTIVSLLKGKDQGLRGGTFAMRDILRTLQKEVQAELGQAALGSWDAYHLKKVLTSIEKHVADFESRARGELGLRLDRTWEGGAEFVEGVFASAGMGVGGFVLSTSVLDTLKDFAFHKAKGLSQSAFEQIRTELTLGMLGQKTPQEVARAVGKGIRGRSIFSSIARRAEVITQTEMGRAFSMSAQSRMDEAAEHVPGIEKMWVHRGHPKAPRYSHLMADGVHVPVNKKFKLVGETGKAVWVKHPRDPAAPIGEVINCGCDHVPYHPGWDE